MIRLFEFIRDIPHFHRACYGLTILLLETLCIPWLPIQLIFTGIALMAMTLVITVISLVCWSEEK